MAPSNKNTMKVSMATLEASNDATLTLEAQSLGSCVAIALYDAENRVGGVAHCMLPLSQADPSAAEIQPCMFTDTGINALYDAMLGLGASPAGIEAKLAGAASLISSGGENQFRIGARNHVVAETLLQQKGIPVIAQDAGGSLPRSFWMDLDTGRSVVAVAGQERELQSENP